MAKSVSLKQLQEILCLILLKVYSSLLMVLLQIFILRVPDIFSDSISALSNFGYEYKISKTDAPWSDTYKVVYQSDGQINRPVSYTFTIGDENWKFEVTPKSGWRNATLLIIIIGIFLTISLLLSVLTRVWLVAKEHKKKFQILARTDSLTNIYNRYGFDEFAEKMIQKNPKTHFVVALLDIDDFKFINDIYGHNYGDRALKNLADSMKTFFPSDALLGRNGGDEFCILLPNCTFAEADIQLQKFTKLPKSFSYHGKEHAFYISLGYAEYPTFASNRSQLMRCADAALYEIKLHGKMDVWSTEKDFGQMPANNLDSHSRISLNIFQVHSSYTELTKKMMN